jgi:hypothetical protein
MQIQRITLSRVSERILITTINVALALTSCSNPDNDVAPNDPDQDGVAESGDMAPDFSLQSLNGSAIS